MEERCMGLRDASSWALLVLLSASHCQVFELSFFPLNWVLLLVSVWMFFHTLRNLQAIVDSALIQTSASVSGGEAELRGWKTVGRMTRIIWCSFPVIWLLDVLQWVPRELAIIGTCSMDIASKIIYSCR